MSSLWDASTSCAVEVDAHLRVDNDFHCTGFLVLPRDVPAPVRHFDALIRNIGCGQYSGIGRSLKVPEAQTEGSLARGVKSRRYLVRPATSINLAPDLTINFTSLHSANCCTGDTGY